MRIRYVSGTLGMFFTLFSNAQVVSDTIKVWIYPKWW